MATFWHRWESQRKPVVGSIDTAHADHLSHRERSPREARRVRGYGLSRNRTPSPQPSPHSASKTRVNALMARGSSPPMQDRKSTRLNSSHLGISYAVFCLKKKKE